MGWGTSHCSLPDPGAVTQLPESLSWVCTPRGQQPSCGGKGTGVQLGVFHSSYLILWPGAGNFPFFPLCQRREPLWGQGYSSRMLTVIFGLRLWQCQEPSLMWLLHPMQRAHSLAGASPWAPRRPHGVYSGEQRIFCENRFASRVLWTVTTCHYGPHLLFVYIAACTIKGIDM